MSFKRFAAFSVLLATLVSVLAFPPAASARVQVGIRVYAPLPPMRHERVLVRPGARYVWVPGYWSWQPYRRHYVWVGGRWLVPPRPHVVWVAPRVVYRHHHPYYYGGYWRR